MRINNIKIQNFRNHLEKEFSFTGGINVIWGDNGVGKTTILEAISVCSMSKSFATNADAILINENKNQYHISANCTNDLNLPYKINISFTPKQPKEISSNVGNRLLPKDIIGEIPLIVLSPDYKKITSGSPESRRQFVNSLLSQASKNYLEKLFALRKILKQRNSLLSNFKGVLTKNNENLLPILHQWSQALINVSTDLIIRRNEFIADFNPIFIDAYNIISNSKENVSIAYQPDTINEKINDKNQIMEILTQRSNTILNGEIKRSTTLFGAQKDDLKISINNGIAKEYASQGQHKSLLLAIKFAEFQYLLEKKNETPIILFDDIFSELDNIRIRKVLELLSQCNAQIFITITDPTIIKNATAIPTNLIEIKN
ncbi:MAG: DNA replication and repair protein RecF [Bacteroidetes bacterium]|nr:DNA replication and repair protein RecF [Bacteroidota bacterium]